MSTRGVIPRPLQWRTAFEAMRALIADPDDTSQVFRIVHALTGNSFERLYQRVLADPVGRRILDEKRDLLRVLQDRERLRSLPDGALGREYARFLDTESISPEGLVDASEFDSDPSYFLDERAHLLSCRLRDAHDLWHVVTGYHRDLFGEVALLAFTYMQTGNGGIGFIVLMAMLREWQEGHGEGIRLAAGGFWRGWRAGFFAAADWEQLLEVPLDDVRRLLAVSPPKDYTPLFSPAAASAHGGAAAAAP
jgi:ubiquinone biosynthesis protein COQ4